MKPLVIENELREVVSRIIYEVELAGKQGRQDINLISEDAWIPILKEVYKCPNLQNLNKKKKNFPGIDLGDEVDRVAFQVTSTTSLDKIKDTLHQFIKMGYNNSFDELYLFTLVKKQDTYSQSAIDKILGDEFVFSAKKHIIDPSDILHEITSLRVGAQSRLLEEFKLILGDIEAHQALLTDQNELPYLLVSNMLEVSFPKYVYVATVDIDEKEVLKQAAEFLNYSKKWATKRLIVKLNLVLNGVYNTDWVYFEDKIFSFTNLNDSVYAECIDTGTIERLESADLFENEFSEYHNLFKELLKNSVKDSLAQDDIKWHKENQIFYFLPKREGDEHREETWFGKRTSKRNVFEVKRHKDNFEKVLYHKHFAFELSFLQVNSKWFALIEPNWLFTENNYKKYAFHEKYLSGKKRLEHNTSVRDNVRFVAYYLNNRINGNECPVTFCELLELESKLNSGTSSPENNLLEEGLTEDLDYEH